MKKVLKGIILAAANAIIYFGSAAQSLPSYQVNVADTASTGFYFFVPQRFGVNPAQFNQNHFILDSKGQLAYYKTFTNGVKTGSFCLQKDGRISYYHDGKFYFADSLLQLVDSVACQNGLATDAHDMQVLPNGHYLMLGTEIITMDLSSYHLFLNNGTPGGASANVTCSVIQELDTAKNVVFEWHAKDYFAFDEVDENFLKGPNNVDWTHCNSVEPDTDGNLLLSVRHFNEVTKINRSDSSIIWRMGGKANQFTFTNDTPQFKGQHDIRRLANGNITLFDNGEDNDSAAFHPAAAKEYTLDENLLTATLTWSYTDDSACFSKATGNVQRLSNGNTLVNHGNRSCRTAMFTCVKPSGQKIFEITFDDTLSSYRSFNYPDWPFSIQRPAINCMQSGAQFFLDAGTGYASYLWSNGATTQTILLSNTGSFQVFIPAGAGGFIGSEVFEVNNLNNPCNLNATQEDPDGPMQMYPNPVHDWLFLSISSSAGRSKPLVITDYTGRIVWSADRCIQGDLKIPTGFLAPGFYFLRAGSQTCRFVKQ